MNEAEKIDFSSQASQMIILPFALSFPEGELKFFMNVHKVVKVIEYDDVHPMPTPMKPFEYLIDFQGISVPVIELKKWLRQSMDEQLLQQNLQAAPSGEQARIVICELLGYYIGIVVNRTFNVKRQNINEIIAAPALFPNVGQEFASGMIREANGFCYLFDLEAFFESQDIKLTATVDDKVDGGPRLAGKSILIVEDSKLYRSILLRVLVKHGALVDVAVNGKEGLEILLERQTKYDAIISDIEMPIMNGIDMITAYRKSSHDVPYVVFHSSISNENLVHDIVDSALGDFLVKFDESNIIERLTAALSNV
ncbi:MAG: chemotaxis protein CheV [Oligoflexus sp.]